MQKRLILYLLAIILISQLVLSLGIRPAKKYFEFMPNEAVDGSFRIINNDNKNLELFIYAEGDLGQYIELEEENIVFSDSEKELSYKINFPSQLPPGSTTGEIVVTESTPLTAADGTQVTAKLKVVYQIIVKTAAPDSYLTAELEITPADEKIDFLTTVENRGKADIKELTNKINIEDNGKLIKNLETEKISLAANEKKELLAKLDTLKENTKTLQNGHYQATASISYDNQVLEIIKEFNIGKPAISLNYLDQYFVTGKINEFNVEFQNDWNTQRKEIYADIILFENNKQIWSTRTVSFDIGSWSSKKITSFLDARNIQPGEYKVDMIIQNGENIDKISKQVFIMTESDYNRQGKEKGTSTTTLLVIAFIVLFITVIVVLIYAIKVIKSKKKQE